MSKPLTPTQRIAWDAIGHAQEHWTAVLAALKAVGPYHRDVVARNIAGILDDYEMSEAAELVRNLPAMEAAVSDAADALRAIADASSKAPRVTTNNVTTVALDDDGDEVMTVDLVCMTCLRPVCGMREWTLAGVVAEAEAHVCPADAGQVHRLAEAFPDAVTVETPASPPQSTETPDESTPEEQGTPDGLNPAEAAIADMYMSDMDGALDPGDTPMRRHWQQHANEMGRRSVAVARPHIYREAAEALRGSEHLRDWTDDHMGDIQAAADWLTRRADKMGDGRG